MVWRWEKRSYGLSASIKLMLQLIVNDLLAGQYIRPDLKAEQIPETNIQVTYNCQTHTHTHTHKLTLMAHIKL